MKAKSILAITHPDLIKEWHPTKNGALTPFHVTKCSHKKVWWKCSVAEDHEWESTVGNRTNRESGCPCCMGFKVVLSNCLSTTHPVVAKQWHPTKNLPLTQFDVTYGSGKRVWWKCDVSEDHEWKVSVSEKVMGAGCSCCSGHTVVLSNCLQTINPEISKQWHPKKNFPLTPFDVTSGSDEKIWWKCDLGDDHEWDATINSRVRGSGCPCCSGRKAVPSNCLYITHPEISKQWHPTKNLPLTPLGVTFGSEKNIWWKCDVSDDHIWQSAIYSRINTRCPCCVGQKVVLSNSLAIMRPDIAKEWHPTKNKNITPFDVVVSSGKKVWWKCSIINSHEWGAFISNRTYSGHGCPFCSASHGEKKIKSVLDEMGIIYESQKKFTDCKYKRELPFDLYLPRFHVLIEYDGHQHFEARDFFGGINSLKTTQRNDNIKNKFSLDNNIPLLRIPYTKFDSIKEEIVAFLSKFNT